MNNPIKISLAIDAKKTIPGLCDPFKILCDLIIYF